MIGDQRGNELKRMTIGTLSLPSTEEQSKKTRDRKRSYVERMKLVKPSAALAGETGVLLAGLFHWHSNSQA